MHLSMRVHAYLSTLLFFLIGDFFIPAFQCPHLVERIGTLGDGGKWVCGMDRVEKQKKCVIYSFGSSLLSMLTSVVRILTLCPRVMLL
jgi:Methyltransferase domain